MHHNLLRHIQACNRLEMGSFVPLLANHKIAALLNPGVQNAITSLPESFVFEHGGDKSAWHFHESCNTKEKRSAALERIREKLHAEKRIGTPRHEPYAVTDIWGRPEIATVDRSAVIALGIPSFGVHVNGFVRRSDGIHMWIGKRSQHKPVAPGQLDNMVAGGQPAGLSLMENVIKESQEEASLPRSVSEKALATGLVRYAFSTDQGTRLDTLFCYDLELPEGVIPSPGDDECESFTLLPIHDVLDIIANTNDFKFNVPLVIIDFAIRHGLITAENSAEYTELVTGLRQPFPLMHGNN